MSAASGADLSAAAGAPSTPSSVSEASFGERLSDRLNPILTREVQQALAGRTFVATLALALFGIVLVALYATSEGGSATGGFGAFTLALQALTPIVLLVLPFHAFLSMRQEVSAGTIEHLLLSRLTPGAIVRGKLLAACVEFLLFVSVFAPLLALTYLLRGVDIPTIALLLGVAFLYGFGATCLAVAMGALGRWPGARALPLIVLALALAVVTASFISGMPYLVQDLRRILIDPTVGFDLVLALTVPVASGSLLLCLVACAALAHPYENRSTAFRVFAVVGLLAGVAWATHAQLGLARIGAGRVRTFIPGFVAVTTIAFFPFWLFATTEEERLSPRVRTLVSRRRVLAALSVPFLPGGGRGVLFTVLTAAVALLCALLVPGWFAGMDPEWKTFRVAAGAWGYTVLYASLSRLLRSRLPAGARGTAIARFAVPLGIAALAMLPVVADLLVRGRTRDWHPFHLLNPAWTLALMETSRHEEILGMIGGATAVAVLLQLPAMVRGVLETMAASRARRSRAP